MHLIGPARLADRSELDLETYARIVAGAAVGTQGSFSIGVAPAASRSKIAYV